jgi:shikimate dehydrogenase
MPRAYYELGLIGYPLDHSLSPLLHEAALKACGLEGKYRLYSSPPAGHLPDVFREILDQLRQGKLQGLNVTIPYKQLIIPWLDKLSPTSHAVGAVNTIFLKDHGLVGENTDVAGFWVDLKNNYAFAEIPHEKNDERGCQAALVLGAGGSARAVVYALSQAGWHVTIAARRLMQAEEVAAAFSSPGLPISVRALKLDSLSDLITQEDIRLIVNTTPLGMFPNVNDSPWPPELGFPERAFVYDLVYNPKETVFMHRARSAGLHAVNGLGMLLEQAALAFECWTGIHPSTNEMRGALVGAKS